MQTTSKTQRLPQHHLAHFQPVFLLRFMPRRWDRNSVWLYLRSAIPGSTCLSLFIRNIRLLFVTAIQVEEPQAESRVYSLTSSAASEYNGKPWAVRRVHTSAKSEKPVTSLPFASCWSPCCALSVILVAYAEAAARLFQTPSAPVSAEGAGTQRHRPPSKPSQASEGLTAPVLRTATVPFAPLLTCTTACRQSTAPGGYYCMGRGTFDNWHLACLIYVTLKH